MKAILQVVGIVLLSRYVFQSLNNVDGWSPVFSTVGYFFVFLACAIYVGVRLALSAASATSSRPGRNSLPCPFCKTMIDETASVCPQCAREIGSIRAEALASMARKAEEVREYYRPVGIVAVDGGTKGCVHCPAIIPASAKVCKFCQRTQLAAERNQTA